MMKHTIPVVAMVVALLALSACKKNQTLPTTDSEIESHIVPPDAAIVSGQSMNNTEQSDVDVHNNTIEEPETTTPEPKEEHCHQQQHITFMMVGKVMIPITQFNQVCDND